jgi:hypothetical protein
MARDPFFRGFSQAYNTIPIHTLLEQLGVAPLATSRRPVRAIHISSDRDNGGNPYVSTPQDLFQMPEVPMSDVHQRHRTMYWSDMMELYARMEPH